MNSVSNSDESILKSENKSSSEYLNTFFDGGKIDFHGRTFWCNGRTRI